MPAAAASSRFAKIINPSKIGLSEAMEAIGAVASVASLLELAAKIVNYISALKNVDEDLKKLNSDITASIGILTTLKTLSESSDPWLENLQALGHQGGPLDKFRACLEATASAFTESKGFRGKLRFPLKKADVASLLSEVEHYKALFTFALQLDHLHFAQRAATQLNELTLAEREQSKTAAEAEAQKVLEWISPLNFHKTQADRLGRRQQGTGTWIMKTLKFRAWMSSPGAVLWCPGLPGAGKTIMASSIIEYLESKIDCDCTLLYIYCMYKQQALQSDSNLLSSLLQQLLQASGEIPAETMAMYRKHLKRGTRPSVNDWTDMLELEIQRNWRRVYVIIDALDECAEDVRTILLENVRSLPLTNLLATSRPNDAIRIEFEEWPCLEIKAIDDDLVRYIEGRFPKDWRLRSHVDSDPRLIDEIEHTVVAEAQGMFLLAQLHMDALSRKHTRREVRQALRSLPRSLDAIYDDAMDRIGRQGGDDYDSNFARKVLYWTSYSLRPLTVVEMQHALGIQLDDSDLDNDGLPSQEILTSLCSGLITIDSQSNVVRLVHYTTQEYLERVRGNQFPGAQGNMASVCLAYLSFDAFASGPCKSDSEMKARMLNYPLLEYAAMNWGHHARGQGETNTLAMCLKLLDHPMKLLNACQSMHLPAFHHSNFSQLFPRNVNSIHFAAGFGLPDLLSFLLQTDRAEPDLKDSNLRGPLSWAAQNGQLRTTEILLEKKSVDVNWKDKNGQTPLILAAANGHLSVAMHLLVQGALPDLQDDEGRTALAWASLNGHGKLVGRMLSLGVGEAGVNVADKTYGRTPLLWASHKGYNEIVRLLLATERVNVHQSDTAYGQTPLMFAAELGYFSIVEQLLEIPGQDIDRPDDTGESALITATRGGYDDIVELLLKYKGVDLIESPSTLSLLAWADSVVLEKVEDTFLQNLSPPSPLPADESKWDDNAAECASLFSGTTLIDRPAEASNPLLDMLSNSSKADVSAIENLAIWATKANSRSIVGLLLKAFPVTFRNEDKLFGRTALAWASHKGYVPVMDLILSTDGGRDSLAYRDHCGQTPISLSSQAGHEGAVARLLKAQDDTFVTSKAGVNAAASGSPRSPDDYPDVLGRSPLSFAAGNGHDGIVQMLMARPTVDVTRRDNYQETALSWAAERGKAAAVEALIRDGRVELDTRNVYGRSPFSLAVGNGFEDVVSMFLENSGNVGGDRRVDIVSRDNLGRTPLAWAVANKQDTTAQMVREYQQRKGIHET